jgi:hypothetical protein
MATTLPLTLIVLATVRLYPHLNIASIQTWLPLLWPVGVAAIVTSAAVAITADRRVRHSRQNTTTGPAGTSIRS